MPLSGISGVRLEIGQSVDSGYLMCLLHRLSNMCMPRLRLLALKGYGSGVVDVLLEHMYSIGWCIVGRQAIWWERMLALDLRKIGTARTFQCFPSLTYNIRGWATYLVEARWVSRVHHNGGTCDNNCSRVDLHYLSHTHHGFHHFGHLLFHGLHIGLHLLLHLLFSVKAP